MQAEKNIQTASSNNIILWRHRHLIRQLIVRELNQQYRASFLGIFWAVITPLFNLLIYTVVFSMILRVATPPPPGITYTLPYALILFAGLIPYTILADVLGKSPSLILSKPSYVKKIVFPLEILGIVTVSVALIQSLIGFGLLLVGVLIFAQTLHLTALLLPIVLAPLLLLVLGMGWFLSSLGVYLRDVKEAVALLLRIWFFLTPLVYPITRVPDNLLWVMKLNPLVFVVEASRNILLWGKFFSWGEWAIWMLIGSTTAILGYIWFDKTRKGFADVL